MLDRLSGDWFPLRILLHWPHQYLTDPFRSWRYLLFIDFEREFDNSYPSCNDRMHYLNIADEWRRTDGEECKFFRTETHFRKPRRMAIVVVDAVQPINRWMATILRHPKSHSTILLVSIASINTSISPREHTASVVCFARFKNVGISVLILAILLFHHGISFDEIEILYFFFHFRLATCVESYYSIVR